jgi:hypothetical protein
LLAGNDVEEFTYNINIGGMHLNLNCMMSTNCFNSILDLKLFLIEHKKNGTLFYLSDIAQLDLDAEFDLFYFLIKPPSPRNTAFPVSAKSFKENLSVEKLQCFYAAYYCTNSVPGTDFFHNLSIYKGRDWVWYYHQQLLEGF